MRWLNILSLALVGTLTGCASIAEPDKAHTLPEDSQTKNFDQIKYITLGRHLDKQGFLSDNNFIKPIIRQFRSPFKQIGLQEVFTTSTHYKKTKTAAKLPFEIVQHPHFGTLEIREITSRALDIGLLYQEGSWRSVTSDGSSSITPPPVTKKTDDKKPEQNEISEPKILHTHALYYTPTGKLTGKLTSELASGYDDTDAIIVKWPAVGKSKSQLVKYIITR